MAGSAPGCSAGGSGGGAAQPPGRSRRAATTASATAAVSSAGSIVGALGGDGDDHRVDAADGVRAAGGAVVVGGVVERLDQAAHAVVGRGVRVVALLQRRLREQRARADPRVAGLLVAGADDVVGHDPAGAGRVGGVEVVADEQRHERQPLHRGAEVAPHHAGQLVGLAVEGQRDALDLLVVLQLDREQAHRLDREPGRARDAGRRVVVGDEDLLHVARGDEVAHGGPPVAGDRHPAGEHRGDDRRPVGHVAAASGVTAGRPPGQEVGPHLAEEVDERGGPGAEVRGGQGRRGLHRWGAPRDRGA